MSAVPGDDRAHVAAYHRRAALVAASLFEQHATRGLCPVCIMRRYAQCSIASALHEVILTRHAAMKEALS